MSVGTPRDIWYHGITMVDILRTGPFPVIGKSKVSNNTLILTVIPTPTIPFPIGGRSTTSSRIDTFFPFLPERVQSLSFKITLLGPPATRYLWKSGSDRRKDDKGQLVPWYHTGQHPKIFTWFYLCQLAGQKQLPCPTAVCTWENRTQPPPPVRQLAQIWSP